MPPRNVTSLLTPSRSARAFNSLFLRTVASYQKFYVRKFGFESRDRFDEHVHPLPRHQTPDMNDAMRARRQYRRLLFYFLPYGKQQIRIGRVIADENFLFRHPIAPPYIVGFFDITHRRGDELQNVLFLF